MGQAQCKIGKCLPRPSFSWSSIISDGKYFKKIYVQFHFHYICGYELIALSCTAQITGQASSLITAVCSSSLVVSSLDDLFVQKLN